MSTVTERWAKRTKAAVDHEHTDECRSASRYAALDARVVQEVSGRVTIQIRASGPSACWSESEVVAQDSLHTSAAPRGPEDLLALLLASLEEKFPLLFV